MTLTPLLVAGDEVAAARGLEQALTRRTARPPALTFTDIHRLVGEPVAARAALDARQASHSPSWFAVGGAYSAARVSSSRRAIDEAWSGYARVCEAERVDPLPLTSAKLLACWSERVIGRGLKSSALQSITSRVIAHARLAGSPTPDAVVREIARDRRQFCETFPCEVRAAAPPLGAVDGLDVAIAFADARAGASPFFRAMAALLHVSKALYCRPSALLAGRLRRCHVAYVPPGPSAQGGVVLSLMLPKKRKDCVDYRLDSHAIPSGPAVLALVSHLDALGLLAPGAPAEGIVFPDIDPLSGERGPRPLAVRRATWLLRRHVFGPAGLPNGDLFTLRSIRSGSSTDAAIAGVTPADRIAQGGWKSAAGAETYLDHCLALLSQPSPPQAK